MIPEFTIEEQFLTSVMITRTGSKFDGRTDLDAQEMLELLQGKHTWTTTKSEDHPVFANLRNVLEAQGHIRIQRGFWNGDRVLTPFKLNGVEFNTSDRFVCAAAMSSYLKYPAPG